MRVEGDPDANKNGLFFFLHDQLGSTTVTLQRGGTGALTKVGELRYTPWGSNRDSGYASDDTPTDYRFTDQRDRCRWIKHYERDFCGRRTNWMKSIKERWSGRARQLQAEVYALYLAYRDPRVPFYARIFAGLVVAYAFSPIDLIPDPIPVLGYLDDLVLVPLGVALALRMIPREVMAESRARAQEIIAQGKPVNRTAAVIIIAIWVLVFLLVVLWIVRLAGEWLGQG